MCWFNPQLATVSSNGRIGGQEPRASSRSPAWVQGSKAIHRELDGSGAASTQASAHGGCWRRLAGGGLTYYSTLPTQEFSHFHLSLGSGVCCCC